ncbi:tumor necrosis factor receptor superfamily member 6 isoform X2 [Dromiciops gliroides]|uniref:tumor necrosis factor receptor superfamily member 6 isoform X2 n=1 Tax=Dromiciops gliroides TaxID=33562 RepID=UPI001CC6CE8B|nr:tumor necrosis factor receptor superfamily member 6 isoform X2 [Dromiciops gliroides]
MSSRRLLPVPLLLLVLIDGGLCRNTMSPLPGIDSKWSQIKKNFTKREATCPEGQHPVGDICCQLCPPGTEKTLDCKVNGGQPVCTNCTEGEDYMDHPHYLDKCIRCSICDNEHGLEVRKNCSILQNVVCGCAKNFFCNTPQCQHCEHCTSCEHGTLTECMENRNTVCKTKGWKRNHTDNATLEANHLENIPLSYPGWKRNHTDNATLEANHLGNIPLSYPDIDLRDYIANIADEMELEQVRKFVRRKGIDNVTIDQVKHDYINDADEQKIQLLKKWYERHGKKGAYKQLILGLEEIGLRVVAERLQETISVGSQAELENGNSSVVYNQGMAST